MTKTLVTHLSPDLDASAAVWLIHRYLPGWDSADVQFVPVETTLNNQPPDQNPDIIHVDTGNGKYDHHTTGPTTSATQLVFEDLKKQGVLKLRAIPALERIALYITAIDNFQEVDFPDPTADVYDFCPHQLMFSLKPVCKTDHALLTFAETLLDAMLISMKQKINAENDIENGYIFQTVWGKSIAMDSKNEESIKLALKQGYQMALRKDPARGFLKIKIQPTHKRSLHTLFSTLAQKDPKAHWSLQGNGHIIINGSSRVPQSAPTHLTLQNVIEILGVIQ